MTKKDYITIAKAIKQEAAMYNPGSSAEHACGMVGYKLSDIFAADNPRFDREKFLKACGF